MTQKATGGAANSYRSLKKPGGLQRRKPKNEKHEMEVENKKSKLSLQLRLLTERNKLHTTKKAWHKVQQRRMPEGLHISPKLVREKPAPRSPSAKDAQEVIQFDQVDHEQVAEKRQAASQAKKDKNLAKQSGVSKNTQHDVK